MFVVLFAANDDKRRTSIYQYVVIQNILRQPITTSEIDLNSKDTTNSESSSLDSFEIE